MFKRPRATFALILAAGFAATPAFAEPPWKRGGEQRDGGYERGGRGDGTVPAAAPALDVPAVRS